MDDFGWRERVRKWLFYTRINELHREEQVQFKQWLRDPPLAPFDRWKDYEQTYSSLDITSVLGRNEYCHDFVRDALRYYLHHITHCDEHANLFEENAYGLAQLINLVYYTERRADSGEEILNEILEAIISAVSKFPRWIKVNVLAKVICTGCPIYVAVRLFNGFDSQFEPLPRSLLQSAAFTKDHFSHDPIREGYSVATRIMGWGSNRLSNLGCHEGSSVDQRSMMTLPRFDGSRVTTFSVGVNHSLFLTEDRKLFVTGRLRNWTGRMDDERIALTPVQVDWPADDSQESSFKTSPNLCRHIYAGANRSEIVFSSDLDINPEKCTGTHVVAGPGPRGSSMEPSRERDERSTEGEPSHTISDDRFILLTTKPILFKGSKKNPLELRISLDRRLGAQGGLFVSDSTKSIPRELRVCIGNVVHRPHSIRQTAFCDNGDVFCLLQVDRTARNYTLVKGEIRRLRVDQMEWTSKKTSKEKKEELYYLVAEQVPGAEHVVQFSVDRNGDNLLFEIRDRPRTQTFRHLRTEKMPLNVHGDPEVCYGGASRSLELLQRERDCGNVLVDEEELIKLSPHSKFLCPRMFLSEEMMEDLKEELPIQKREVKRQKKERAEQKGLIQHHHHSRNSYTKLFFKDKWDYVIPIPDRYYGASFENGSLRVAIPRSADLNLNMRTKQYDDSASIVARIECYIKDLFPFYSFDRVKVNITGESDSYTFVTLRPEIVFDSLHSEAAVRGLKKLRVTYNGEHEFDIVENLWALHTPHFNRSVFHSSSITPIECPFPESVMRMCERAFVDPSSTENYTTIQLLNMLDVADYLCANLLAQDVIYRLLRNATRADINEILAEIVQALNSRPCLVVVLSRFPHILLDWPLDLESDILHETCEMMHKEVGPVSRDINGIPLIPSHCNLSLFILASPNCELGVAQNELPLSNDVSREAAISNIFNNLPGDETVLSLIDREDRLSLLFDAFKGEKGVLERSKRLFEECYRRYEGGGVRATMDSLRPRISTELEKFLTAVPSPVATPLPHKEKSSAKRTRRRTERMSEREEVVKEGQRRGEEETVEHEGGPFPVAATMPTSEAAEEPSTSKGERVEEQKVPTLSFSEILKQEEEMEAAKKPWTPKKGEAGKKSKFRPISFSDSAGSPTAKIVDKKHDWTQSPRQETPKENRTASFSQIMKEQSERKQGVTRRRGPSVSGCQMEAAAIEALGEHYTDMVENHQLVAVEVCRREEEAPKWNADGDLYLD